MPDEVPEVVGVPVDAERRRLGQQARDHALTGARRPAPGGPVTTTTLLGGGASLPGGVMPRPPSSPRRAVPRGGPAGVRSALGAA